MYSQTNPDANSDSENKAEIIDSPISKALRSAPSGRICKFDPPFDASGSELSSALQINIVGQTLERMTTIL